MRPVVSMKGKSSSGFSLGGNRGRWREQANNLEVPETFLTLIGPNVQTDVIPCYDRLSRRGEKPRLNGHLPRQ